MIRSNTLLQWLGQRRFIVKSGDVAAIDPALRQRYEARPRHIHAALIPRWKQSHVAPFLVGPHGCVTFHRSLARAEAAARRDSTPLAIWASKEPEGFNPSVPVLRVEDGFLRSRGLGSDLLRADSLCCDAKGIYFDATRPSDLETYLNTHDFTEEELARAAKLRASIVAHGLSKYNLSASPLPPLPTGCEIHLVIGQVEDDASIKRGVPPYTSLREGEADEAIQSYVQNNISSGLLRYARNDVYPTTNAGLVKAVRAAHPDAFIIYKPHPDVVAGNRKSSPVDSTLASLILPYAALNDLLPHIHHLHTLTSLSGFEALLRGVNVTCYGMPFYAGWGLTHDMAAHLERRTRTLTLDMLVYGTFIEYPLYYDWQTRLSITPEQQVQKMLRITNHESRITPRQFTRFARWLSGYLK